MRRIPSLTSICPDAGSASGIRGHIWEQFGLPLRTGSDPLWSPSTSGPVLHRNHIVTVHDVAFIDVPQYFSRQFARWYAAMTRVLVGTARHIITVSEFTRRRLMELFGTDGRKISAIHLGVSTAFRRYEAVESAPVRSQYQLDDRPYVVGFLGTDPRKNTAHLLAAWKQAGMAQDGGKLVLFGRSANKAVFSEAEMPDQVEGVVPVGAVDDSTLAALYSGAAGFVFPSYYEGFGLPVIEAASCGCRIVTSNLSSLPEVSPSDAVLIDPNDTGRIAEVIRQLFDSPDTEGARMNRMNEMRKFNWDLAAAQYSQLFNRVFFA